jgi:hypothetical protein
MEFVTIKMLVEFGILIVIAYSWIRSKINQDKREEQIVNNSIDKLFSSDKKSPEEPTEYIPNNSKVTLDRVVIEELKNYQDKNIQEHNELKDILRHHGDYFKDIKKDISDLYIIIKRGESTDIKNKQYQAVIRTKIADALPYFNNENLRYFVVEHCQVFGDWIMESMNYIFNSPEDMELAIQKLKTNCNQMKLRCEELLSADVCAEYFRQREIDIEEFTNKMRYISAETINDKTNRFFSMSILFMQDSVSKILTNWIRINSKDWKMVASMDGMDELKRLEERKSSSTKIIIDKP